MRPGGLLPLVDRSAGDERLVAGALDHVFVWPTLLWNASPMDFMKVTRPDDAMSFGLFRVDISVPDGGSSSASRPRTIVSGTPSSKAATERHLRRSDVWLRPEPRRERLEVGAGVAALGRPVRDPLEGRGMRLVDELGVRTGGGRGLFRVRAGDR